jgi:quinol monooxygenase YgiN
MQMIALLVTIRIQPPHREAFMEAMLDDASHSVQDEPGCLRFDVLEDINDPNVIYLYEVYRDEGALEAHRQAPHFLRWKRTTRDWFEGEVVVGQAAPVYPAAADWTG